MKRILLATVSVVAFAGAAAAQDLDSSELGDGVSFGGDTVFGYNEPQEGGFFLESSLAPRLSRTLDSGIEAGVLFSFDIANEDEDEFGNADDFSVNNDFLFFIEAPNASFFFGDTEYAAETHWSEDKGPGAVGEMAADGFSEQTDEVALRGTGLFFTNIEASISFNIADADGDGVGQTDDDEDDPDTAVNEATDDNSEADVDQASFGASGTFGQFSFSLGYQEDSDAIEQEDEPDDPSTPDNDEFDEDTSDEGVYDTDNDDDFNIDEIFAASVGATFAGFDVELGYAQNISEDLNSIGVQGSYPVGPFILSANYVFESAETEDDPTTDDDEAEDADEDSYRIQADYENGPFTALVFYESEQGDEDLGTEATYDLGNGLSFNAGYSDDDEGFVAAAYDLGNEGVLTVSYAEVEDAGTADYKEGTTVQVAFNF